MKSLTAFHDFTNAFGSVKVGGDGPSCRETVGTELSSWAGETGWRPDDPAWMGISRSKLGKED